MLHPLVLHPLVTRAWSCTPRLHVLHPLVLQHRATVGIQEGDHDKTEDAMAEKYNDGMMS